MDNLNEQIRNKRAEMKKYALKRRNKVILISSGAVLLAILTGFGVGCSQNSKKKNDDIVPTTSSTYTASTYTTSTPVESTSSKVETPKINNLKTDSLNSLGTKLEFPKEEEPKKEIGEVTGNVNPNKIVVDEEGTVWATPEAESKKDNVDKVVIDDKDGSLEVKPDGTVYEKTPTYEIKDESGNVISTGTLEGSNGLPNDWSNDSSIDKNIPSNEASEYVTDAEGNVWSKLDYDEYLKALEDAKNNKNIQVETEVIPVEPVIIGEISETVVNPDETSSIVVEPNETSSIVVELDETSKETISSSEDSNTTSIPAAFIPKVDTSNLYFVPDFNLYFESKADFEQWVMQGYEGYRPVNGVMVSETKEMNDALENFNKSR